MRRMGWRIIPVLLAVLFAGWQWFGADTFINPETGDKARVGLSTEQEEQLGIESYREILSQSSVARSGPELDLVLRVAKRLAAATGEAGREYEWQATLIESDQVNAFCLPGGKIAVYTGILPVAKDEAGLAVVMGHEMAHAIARHGAQRILQQQSMNTLLTGAQFSLGGMDYETQRAVMGALGAGAQYGVSLPFSRDHETEADTMGLMYSARAGYDPRVAPAFWQRMAQASGGRGQPPEFASTHPSHDTRIANLEAQMPRALAEYEKHARAPLGGTR
ncbi:MAG: M48 family metallopeptidase [Planctomycetes bacterium]|nr:M48 family metallopeptidase [Planctomycetota bacterium]